MDTIMIAKNTIGSGQVGRLPVDLVWRVHRLGYKGLAASMVKLPLAPVVFFLGNQPLCWQEFWSKCVAALFQTSTMARAFSHCGCLIRSHGVMPRRKGSA